MGRDTSPYLNLATAALLLLSKVLGVPLFMFGVGIIVLPAAASKPLKHLFVREHKLLPGSGIHINVIFSKLESPGFLNVGESRCLLFDVRFHTFLLQIALDRGVVNRPFRDPVEEIMPVLKGLKHACVVLDGQQMSSPLRDFRRSAHFRRRNVFLVLLADFCDKSMRHTKLLLHLPCRFALAKKILGQVAFCFR